jgi:hypothetical protein
MSRDMLWVMCAVSVGVALTAILADRRRNRRAELDKVGFMPWPLILILSILIAAVAAALALK